MLFRIVFIAALFMNGSLFASQPKVVATTPDYLPLTPNWKHFLGISRDNDVAISDITPQILDQLTDPQLRELLIHLKEIDLRIKWWSADGEMMANAMFPDWPSTIYSWEKSNAAKALVLSVAAKNDLLALARIFVAAPEAIIPDLKGESADILSADTIAFAMDYIADDVVFTNPSQAPVEIAKIFKFYIRHKSQGNESKQSLALSELIFKLHGRLVSQAYSTKQKGILLGGMLSGALLHINEIKSNNKRKVFLINTISHIALGATSILGLFPVATNISMVASGALSLGTLLYNIIFNNSCKTDRALEINEIEGHLEFLILEQAQKKPNLRLDALEILAYINASMHVNSLGN